MKLVNRISLIFLISIILSAFLFLFYIIPVTKNKYLTDLEKGYQTELEQIEFYLNEFILNLKRDTKLLLEQEEFNIEKTENFPKYLNVKEEGIPVYKKTKKEKEIVKLFSDFRNFRRKVKYLYIGFEDGSFISDKRIINRNIPKEQVFNYDPRIRPWYKGAIEKPDKIILSEIYSVAIMKDNKKYYDYYLTIASTLRNSSGKIIGVFGMDIETNELSNYVSSISGNRKGNLCVLQKKSIVSIDQDGILKLRNEKGIDNCIKIIEDIGSENRGIRKLKGEKYFIVKKNIKNLDWKLFYILSLDNIYKEVINRTIPYVITVIIILFMLTIFIIFGLNIFALKPIKKLINLISEIANTGNLNNKISIVNENDELGMLAIAFNKMIDELKIHKENLEELISERTKELAKYLKVIDQNSSAIIIIDKDEKIEYINPKFTELTHYEKEDIIGKKIDLIDTTIIPKGIYRNIWYDILIKDNWKGEIYNKKKNGKRFWEHTSISTVRDQKGEVSNIVAIKEDITEEKIRREKTEKALKRVETLFNASLALSTEVNLNKTLTIILKELRKVVPYNAASIQELKNNEFIVSYYIGSEDYKEKIGMTIPLEGSRRNLRLKKRKEIIVLDIENDKNFKYVSTSKKIKSWLGIPLIYNGELIGELTLESVRKNLYNDEIASVVSTFATQVAIAKKNKEYFDELEKSKEEAENLAKVKSDFLANMSHEIRTPMNAIIGLNSLMENTNLDEKQSDYVRKIKNSAKSLLGIINDILDFSKIEAGKLKIENIKFNMDHVIDNISGILSLKAFDKGIEFVILKDKEVPKYLIGDPLRLEQVLLNLSNNAVKFTDEGEVLIKIQLKENMKEEVILKFEVKDTGIGMTDEQVKKLFTAFNQADTSITRKYGGTGLGLSISKRIVEIFGGNIQVESEYKKGSNFFFELKFKRVEEELEKERKIPPKLKNLKILIVDDNDSVREVLKNYITELDFKYKEVKSGEEAIEELKNNNEYDLVLMDWKMPEINGIETWQIIKKQIFQDKLPKIILTNAYGREEISSFASNAGIDVILHKPIFRYQLFNSIMKVFGLQFKLDADKENRKNEFKELEKIRGAKILLVEDNEINQEVAQETLEIEGFWVDVAENGEIAIEKILEDKYDLVLMDLQMPILDGYETSKKLREEHNIKNLPILALSADAVSGTKEKVINAGMNDYIAKPIEKKDLFNALVKWIKPGKRIKNIKKQKQINFISKENLEKNLKNIQLDKALERVSGNISLYINVLKKFYTMNINFKRDIAEILEKFDREELKKYFHTVKGVAGNIGAEKLSQNIESIESKIKNLKKEELMKLENDIKIIGEEIDYLLKQIQEVLNETDNILLIKTEDEISKSELIKELIKLRDQVENYDAEAIETYGRLKKYMEDYKIEEKYDVFGQYIEDYNYETALEILNKIIEGES